MPSYDTPAPISAHLDLFVGNVTVRAGDRPTTDVEIRPTDPNDESNVRAAEQTRTEFTDGVLRIKAPRLRGWIGKKSWSVDITLDLPAGSAMHATASMGWLTAIGTLGDCQLKSGLGNLRLDRTAALSARTVGDIRVGRITGHAEVSSGSGEIRIGVFDGTGTVKNSNGSTAIVSVTGAVTVRSSNGEIALGDVDGGVFARAASGAIRIERAVRGRIDAETSFGNVQVDVAEGTVAKLDLETKFGQLDTALESTDGPEATDDVVTVRAHTSYGDIQLHRA